MSIRDLLSRKRGLSPEEQAMKAAVPYDPETQYAVIRSSICTGEKVAGFKSRETGRFKEVMLIRNAQDEAQFRRIYNLETVITEY